MLVLFVFLDGIETASNLPPLPGFLALRSVMLAVPKVKEDGSTEWDIRAYVPRRLTQADYSDLDGWPCVHPVSSPAAYSP